ncbi:hypothetical protein [Streptomyces lunalinharesii]|uniref:Uncharacterized protein n=1 Tax=Streptomyces lunalinharesii TaxID=333384 RepID=A0ABN3T714_9ACTN
MTFKAFFPRHRKNDGDRWGCGDWNGYGRGCGDDGYRRRGRGRGDRVVIIIA